MSLVYGAGDVAAMLRGPLALDVLVNGQCVRGFYDEADAIGMDAMGEPRKIRTITLRVLNGCLGELVVGQDLEVDGIAFQLRDLLVEDDGAVLALTLVRQT